MRLDCPWWFLGRVDDRLLGRGFRMVLECANPLAPWIGGRVCSVSVSESVSFPSEKEAIPWGRKAVSDACCLVLVPFRVSVGLCSSTRWLAATALRLDRKGTGSQGGISCLAPPWAGRLNAVGVRSPATGNRGVCGSSQESVRGTGESQRDSGQQPRVAELARLSWVAPAEPNHRNAVVTAPRETPWGQAPGI